MQINLNLKSTSGNHENKSNIKFFIAILLFIKLMNFQTIAMELILSTPVIVEAPKKFYMTKLPDETPSPLVGLPQDCWGMIFDYIGNKPIIQLLSITPSKEFLIMARKKVLSIAINIPDSLPEDYEYSSLQYFCCLSEVVFEGRKSHKFAIQATQMLQSLKFLALAPRSIGPIDIQLLVEALEKNTTLTSLNILDNYIGLLDSILLAKFLEKNTTLTLLNIKGNPILDDGVIQLAQALEKNTTLTSLNIALTGISGISLQPLTQALKKNTTLTSLNIMDNYLDDADVQSLIEKTTCKIEW